MKWIIELFLEFWTEPKQNQKEHLVYLLCRFSTRATVYALFFTINFNLTKFLWFYLSSSSLVCMCHECGYVRARARAPARAFVCVRLSMVFIIIIISLYIRECGLNSLLSTEQPTQFYWRDSVCFVASCIIFLLVWKSFAFFASLSLSFFLHYFAVVRTKGILWKLARENNEHEQKEDEKLLTMNGSVFGYDDCNDGKGFV